MNFISNIRDALVDAGHNVTAIVPYYDPNTKKYGFRETREIRIPFSEKAIKELQTMDVAMSNIWFSDLEDAWSLAPTIPYLAAAMAAQCQDTINHPKLLETLMNEHFDVGFTENFDYCGVGILHHIGVKSLITASSSNMFDHVMKHIGAPHALNWVPAGMGAVPDKMTLKQKIINLSAYQFDKYFFDTITDMAQKVFEEKFGKEFPSLMELNSKASLVVTNSDPIIDFPRPTLNKIIDIGGIGYSKLDHATPLDEYYASLLTLRPHTILLSFGSVAKSSQMPIEMRNNLLKTFAMFPNTTFLWKYEDKEVTFAKDVENVVLEPWLPQKQLFASGKIQLFITHGGMGSVSEAMRNAVPMIAVPLFADQPRNALLAEKHGCAVIVDKKDILNGGRALEEAIAKVKNEKKFTTSANRISEMYKKRPFTPEELLTRNVEFAGTFGYLENWDPQSRHMSYIEYYWIDLILIVLLAVTTVFYVVYRILKLLLQIGMKQSKVKSN